MIHSLLALAAIAGTPQRATTVQPAATYILVNAIAIGGFETSPIAAAWSNPGSWGDPVGDGDPDDFIPIANGRTTGMHHNGSAAFSFDLNWNWDHNLQGMYSGVQQTLSTPVNSNAVTSATMWAWSDGGKWNPATLTVEIDYSDASPSYYYQDILDSEYAGNDPNKGWRLVDFKSAIKAGKTITKIVASTEHYGYDAPMLFLDDVSLIKKVPLIYLP